MHICIQMLHITGFRTGNVKNIRQRILSMLLAQEWVTFIRCRNRLLFAPRTKQTRVVLTKLGDLDTECINTGTLGSYN